MGIARSRARGFFSQWKFHSTWGDLDNVAKGFTLAKWVYNSKIFAFSYLQHLMTSCNSSKNWWGLSTNNLYWGGHMLGTISMVPLWHIQGNGASCGSDAITGRACGSSWKGTRSSTALVCHAGVSVHGASLKAGWLNDLVLMRKTHVNREMSWMMVALLTGSWRIILGIVIRLVHPFTPFISEHWP